MKAIKSILIAFKLRNKTTKAIQKALEEIHIELLGPHNKIKKSFIYQTTTTYEILLDEMIDGIITPDRIASRIKMCKIYFLDEVDHLRNNLKISYEEQEKVHEFSNRFFSEIEIYLNENLL